MTNQHRKNRAATPDALLLIGRVGKTHGVRGEVKVVPETDDPERFAALATVFIGSTPDTARAYTVASVRYQQSKRGTTIVLKLEGIDTMEAAATLRRLAVFAHEEDLPALEDDEYFFHDVIGLDVVTNRDALVGTVKEVLDLPAHPVFVVARPSRADVMIPAVPAFVADVDLDGGRLVIRPIEGLLD